MRNALGSKAVAAVTLSAGLLPCQVTWEHAEVLETAWGLAAAFDVNLGRVVGFGGFQDYDTYVAGTWTWDGTTWARLQPSVQPSLRFSPEAAYDEARRRLVLFGGRQFAAGPDTFLGDTWEWDGVRWSNRTGTVAPRMRSPAVAMVYDAARQRTVLVGAGTWEWDGSTWMPRTNVGAVAGMPLMGHGLVYDPVRERVVLYGGSDLPGNVLNVGTWEYDGRSWTQRSPARSPTPQAFTTLAYDWAREQVVLFGGRGETHGGRYAETWLYATTAPAVVSQFGSGCPGTGGIASLAATGRPWLGDSLGLRLANLPPAPTWTVLGLGLSRTAWGTIPLPAPLAPIGAGTCTLYASLDAILGRMSGGTQATFQLPPIPSSNSLVGLSFFAQGFALDPPANPAGIVASQAVEARIGAR